MSAKRTRRPALSHVDAEGRIQMVDVSAKAVTAREAIAVGRITMSAAALRQIRKIKYTVSSRRGFGLYGPGYASP